LEEGRAIVLSRYETVLAGLDAGVVVHAADTSIIEANGRARTLLGMQDLDGRLASDPQWEFLESDGSAMSVDRFPVMQVIESQAPLMGFPMIVRPPGRADEWVEVNALPRFDDDGELCEVVVSFIDRTLQVERQRAVDAALEQVQATADYSRRLLEAALDPLVTISPDGRITDVNAATETITGRSRSDLIGTEFTSYFTSPEDARAGYEQAFREGQVVDYPLAITHASGRVTPVLYNASVYRNEDGDVVGVFAAARDITEATAIADALEKSEKAFRLAIDGAPQGMAVIGLDLEFLQVNPALCALLGHSEAWMLAHGLVDVIPPSELSVALTGNEELVTGAAHMTVHEGQWLRADGSLVWVVHSTALLREPDGTPASYVAHIQDNTDAHKIREDLLDRANHDPLTGLVNRDQLQAHIDHLLTLPPQSAGQPAVLFCDIDAFKKVNDTYGHLAGDEVLRVVAHRIAAALRLTDIAARVGGDEFVVVLDAVPEQATAVAVAEKICRAIMQPLSIEGHADTTVTSCVGIALGSAGIDAHRLMRNADAALYQAKGEGSNRVAIFNSPARSSLAMEIRDSIRAGRFVPHFQPIVTIDDGALAGYEALARWVHPDGRLLAPDEFLVDVTRGDLIVELDRAILLRSLDALGDLPAPLHMAVNVSAGSLGLDGYAAVVIDAITQRGLDPDRLHLELTESDLLSVTTTVKETMDELVRFGVHWYVDDFGTGYSSISHLRDLPIAGLKLDLSFTALLASEDPTSLVLAQGLVGMASGLGLDTVAEGVETIEQAAMLSAQGWRCAQGWLYGHPTAECASWPDPVVESAGAPLP